MVVLNDFGLLFEISGFVIFLAVPIQKVVTGGYLLIHKAPESKGAKSYIDKYPKLENLLRGLGITIIIAGLIMQFSFFN